MNSNGLVWVYRIWTNWTKQICFSSIVNT